MNTNKTNFEEPNYIILLNGIAHSSHLRAEDLAHAHDIYLETSYPDGTRTYRSIRLGVEMDAEEDVAVDAARNHGVVIEDEIEGITRMQCELERRIEKLKKKVDNSHRSPRKKWYNI